MELLVQFQRWEWFGGLSGIKGGLLWMKHAGPGEQVIWHNIGAGNETRCRGPSMWVRAGSWDCFLHNMCQPVNTFSKEITQSASYLIFKWSKLVVSKIHISLLLHSCPLGPYLPVRLFSALNSYLRHIFLTEAFPAFSASSTSCQSLLFLAPMLPTHLE